MSGKFSFVLPKTPIEFLLVILFVLSPLHWAPSLGGTGFDLPLNITVWMAAILVIAYGIWQVSGKQHLVLPAVYAWLALMPTAILLSALIAGVVNPTEWFFRISFVLCGVVFLFGLFQTEIKSKDKILLFILLSTLVQAILALFQYIPIDVGFNILQTTDEQPLGNFQQVNVLASFLATGVLISTYLLLRPVSYQRPSVQASLLIVTGILTFVMVATGSRVGLLSVAIGLPLLLLSYRSQLSKRWRVVLALFVIVIAAGVLAKEGAERTLDKTYRIVEAQHADQRVSIYKISIDAITKAPVTGHGIGSFLAEWGKASVDFHRANPEARLPQYLLHPHNELLMWSIEGGLIAVLGILTSLIVVIFWVFRSGFQQNQALLVLMIPISLHTMVEHPFYLSGLHWFVWLTLLFVLLSAQPVKTDFMVSHALRKSLKGLALLIAVMGSLLMLQTGLAQSQIYQLATRASEGVRVHHASQNPYFADTAEQMINRIHIQNAIAAEDRSRLIALATHLESQIELKPELKLFEDLLTTYKALELRQEYCKTVHAGLGIYPVNRALNNEANDCE